MKTATKVLAALGGTSAIIGVLWTFALWAGLQPVLFFQHEALAAQVEENTEDRLRDDLRELRIQRSKNMRDQKEFVQDGQSVPDWLIEELEDLQIEILEVEKELEEIQ